MIGSPRPLVLQSYVASRARLRACPENEDYYGTADALDRAGLVVASAIARRIPAAFALIEA